MDIFWPSGELKEGGPQEVAIEGINIGQALKIFATEEVHQSQAHIKPMHRYAAFRLVLEGGFLPDEITPHPPLTASRVGKGWSLKYTPDTQNETERVVFGGMKTKKIDVLVSKDGIGPVIAISVKGTFRAYRNLVNRMEEAIGDSTNIHVMYPGLVYGFLSLIRANREEEGYSANDLGISRDGAVSPQIRRYLAALTEMSGRQFVRDDYTRYESVGLALVENSDPVIGTVHQGFPPLNSALRVESFFSRLFVSHL